MEVCKEKKVNFVNQNTNQASIVRSFLKDKLGSSYLQANLLCKKMEEAGLVDVKSDYGSVPVCWGGYVGKLVYEV